MKESDHYDIVSLMGTSPVVVSQLIVPRLPWMRTRLRSYMDY